MPKDVWEKIKRFQKAENTAAFCSREVGWSDRCVRRVYASETYEEYLGSVTKHEERKKKDAPACTVTSVNGDAAAAPSAVDLLFSINRLLTAIATELGCVRADI